MTASATNQPIRGTALAGAQSAWTAVFYLLSSIVIGPAIVVAGVLNLGDGGDPCGRSHGMGNADGRAPEYLAMDVISLVGGGAMAAIGIAVLMRLWRRGRQLSLWLRLLLTAGVLIMILGYGWLMFAGFFSNTPHAEASCAH